MQVDRPQRRQRSPRSLASSSSFVHTTPPSSASIDPLCRRLALADTHLSRTMIQDSILTELEFDTKALITVSLPSSWYISLLKSSSHLTSSFPPPGQARFNADYLPSFFKTLLSTAHTFNGLTLLPFLLFSSHFLSDQPHGSLPRVRRSHVPRVHLQPISHATSLPRCSYSSRSRPNLERTAEAGPKPTVLESRPSGLQEADRDGSGRGEDGVAETSVSRRYEVVDRL